jgi:membrane-associated protease RseP (regulator of RpoE activity)
MKFQDYAGSDRMERNIDRDTSLSSAWDRVKIGLHEGSAVLSRCTNYAWQTQSSHSETSSRRIFHKEHESVSSCGCQRSQSLDLLWDPDGAFEHSADGISAQGWTARNNVVFPTKMLRSVNLSVSEQKSCSSQNKRKKSIFRNPINLFYGQYLFLNFTISYFISDEISERSYPRFSSTDHTNSRNGFNEFLFWEFISLH